MFLRKTLVRSQLPVWRHVSLGWNWKWRPMGKVQEADENAEFRSDVLPRLLRFVNMWFILHWETFRSNCWIPCHSVPPLFSLVGVLWRTKQNTIDAILIQWHANKWQGILQLSQPLFGTFCQPKYSTGRKIDRKLSVLKPITPRLYGEKLSRIEGSPAYPSYPGRASFS